MSLNEERSQARAIAVRDAFITVSVAGSSFMNSFFSGALTVSLPWIQRSLNIPASALQWPVALYSLVLGSLLLPAGRLADIYGPRRLFLIGNGSYFLVSLAVALAPNQIGFSAFCSLLGVCAAVSTPSGVGILGSHFEPGPKKNFAFASLGAGQPLGFITGLIVGAILTETKLGWRTSFYVQAGLAALFEVLGFFVIPSSFPLNTAAIPLVAVEPPSETASTVSGPIVVDLSSNRRVDWIGTALAVSGLVTLCFALADASSEPRGWKTPWLPPLIPVALLILVGFFLWEARVQRAIDRYYTSDFHDGKPTTEQRPENPPAPPLLSPGIWSAPHLKSILAIVFFGWSAFNTTTFYLALLMQLVVRVSPVTTAIWHIPMIISGVIFNVIPGYLMSRVNGRPLIIFSTAVSLVAPILLAVVQPHHGYWRAIFPIVATAPATDMCYTLAAVLISKAASRSQQATAGALFNVTSRLATSMSLAIVSSIATLVSNKYLQQNPFGIDGVANTTESPEVLLAGYRVAAWMCFGFAVIAMIVSVLGLRDMGMIGKKEDKAE